MTQGRETIRRTLDELARLAGQVQEAMTPAVEDVAYLVFQALQDGRRLFFCGNGGSAADAQHLAAEYVVRFRNDRQALPALALTTDTSVLTAAGNDLGFQKVFARQVEALGGNGDLLFLHSTSGESENLLEAARAGRKRGMITVAMLARGGGRLAGEVDRALVVPTDSTARAQEIHLALGHGICELVEALLEEDSGSSSATEGGEA